MDRDSYILRPPIPILVLLILSLLLPGFAQESGPGPTPSPLREVASANTPPQYRIMGPVHCGPDGGLFTAAVRTGAGSATTVIRFNGDPAPGQPLSVSQFGNPDEYSIYDYAPDAQSGLFATEEHAVWKQDCSAPGLRIETLSDVLKKLVEFLRSDAVKDISFEPNSGLNLALGCCQTQLEGLYKN